MGNGEEVRVDEHRILVDRRFLVDNRTPLIREDIGDAVQALGVERTIEVLNGRGKKANG